MNIPKNITKLVFSILSFISTLTMAWSMFCIIENHYSYVSLVENYEVLVKYYQEGKVMDKSLNFDFNKVKVEIEYLSDPSSKYGVKKGIESYFYLLFFSLATLGISEYVRNITLHEKLS